MDLMSLCLQSPYVETLTRIVMVLRDGALGGNGLDETMRVRLWSDGIRVLLGACSPSLFTM